MIIHLRSVDRKAALLAGYELPEQPTMEASPKDFGEDWPLIVKHLDVASNGTATLKYTVTAPTVEAVIGAVKDQEAKNDQGWAMIRASAEAALAAYAAAMLTPFDDLPTASINVYELSQDGRASHFLGETQGVRADYISAPSRYDDGVPDRHTNPLFDQLDKAQQALRARIDAENKARADAARPELRIKHAAEQEARKAKLREEEAAKQAAITARAAERLATGYWERETSPYNQRRYGKPWCARVTGVESGGKTPGRLIYEWGEWSGRFGQAGLLRAACKPGDIIAWGQPDNRGRKGEHYVLRMLDNGRMEEISIPDAAKALRAKASSSESTEISEPTS